MNLGISIINRDYYSTDIVIIIINKLVIFETIYIEKFITEKLQKIRYIRR